MQKCGNLCKRGSIFTPPTPGPALGAPILHAMWAGGNKRTVSKKKKGHCAEVSERSHFTWTAQPLPGSYLKPAAMQEASISATKINTSSHTVYLKQLFCNSCSSLSFQHLLKEVMQAGRNRNSCGCAMFANAACGKQHKTSNCREMRQA